MTKTAPALNANDDAAVRRAAALMQGAPRPLRLDARVQHYAWGDRDFIPALLGQRNRSQRPFAELWIGAHHDLPAIAWVDGNGIALDRLIAAAPNALLGSKVASRFDDTLPFLFKLLAVRQPLSIQAHPNRHQALAGFEHEQRAGIAIDSVQRNYRDHNHKPELLMALTDFYALRGFRPLTEIAQQLASTPELQPLTKLLEHCVHGLDALYRHLMRLPQQAVNALLDPLVQRLAAEHRKTAFQQDDARFWLLHADRIFSRPGHRDPGLLSMLLLNLIHLRPGQGIFLPAGALHSYLQGVGLELMANSNNVLRGGLTPKHIDVNALLGVVRFDAGPAQIIEPFRIDAACTRYRVPTTEFELEALVLQAAQQRQLPDLGIRLALVLDGALGIDANGKRLHLKRGQSFLIPAGCETTLRAMRPTRLYLANVPNEANNAQV